VKQAFARAQYGDEAATSPVAVRSFEKQETQYVLALGIASEHGEQRRSDEEERRAQSEGAGSDRRRRRQG
jgi:hypothetical protein